MENRRPFADRWFVYIVRCHDGSLYTGITRDLIRRCQQHNDGKASRYTRGRLPTKLVYHEILASRGLALKREAAIKAMTRQEKKVLILLCQGDRRVWKSESGITRSSLGT